MAKRNENNTLQIRFFTLSPETIQFVLSEKNVSLDTSSVIDSESGPNGDYSPTSPRNYYSQSAYSSSGRSYHTSDYDEEPDNERRMYSTTKATPPIRASTNSGGNFKFGTIGQTVQL